MNGGTWLARILPALTSGERPAYLRDTWMTTNIVFLQDLALWLPLNAVAAAWLWARTPRGYLPGGASVVMGVIESISIAVDKWYGHAADPGSAVASAALVCSARTASMWWQSLWGSRTRPSVLIWASMRLARTR